MKAQVDQHNLILGCPYDGEEMGIVTGARDASRVPIASLAPPTGVPAVKKLDVVRCSRCQRTFLVSKISSEGDFREVDLMEVPR